MTREEGGNENCQEEINNRGRPFGGKRVREEEGEGVGTAGEIKINVRRGRRNESKMKKWT